MASDSTATLRVELVAADRVVWSGEATEVSARTAEGDIGVLRDHAPLLSLLVPGIVRIESTDGGRVIAAVEEGFISVADNRVSILSEDASLANEIDAAQAQAALEQAQADGDELGVLRAEARLAAQKAS